MLPKMREDGSMARALFNKVWGALKSVFRMAQKNETDKTVPVEESMAGKPVVEASDGQEEIKPNQIIMRNGLPAVGYPAFSFFRAPVTNLTPSRTFSLREVFDFLCGTNAASQTTELRTLIDKQAARTYKANNFDFVTFSGKFVKRNEEGLTERSYLLCLDVDHVPDPAGIINKLRDDQFFDLALAFISPSGDGVKLVLPVPFPEVPHKAVFGAIANYMKVVYGIKVDKACQDICRACFLPHDPNAYVNPSPIVGLRQSFDVQRWLELNNGKKVDKSPCTNLSIYKEADLFGHVSAVVDRIIHAGIDIAPDYPTWIRVGFALASSFGENGRPFFHHVSQLYPRYSREEADKQYTLCLRGKGRGVTIATFFEIAKRAGIDISVAGNVNKAKNVKKAEKVSSTPDGYDGIKMEDKADKLKDKTPFPTFSDRISGHCPAFVQKILNMTSSPMEADLLILGALGMLGPCFSKIYTRYGHKEYHPCLFVFVLGIASGGKGVLTHCRQLVMRIHNELRDRAKAERESYERSKREKSDEMLSQKPHQRMLFIPANTSATAVYQILDDNDGVGLIFENEADTMAIMFESDFGNYSSGLRKIFEEEPVCYHRRGDDEHVEIEKPKAAVVLSGTYDQVKKMISDTENGLFSRFCFYSFESDLAWRNMFDEDDAETYDTHMKNLGADVKALFDMLQSSPEIRVAFTSQQQKIFLSFFEKNHSMLLRTYGMDLYATSHRLGVIALRIAMILSALRIMEDGNVSESITCTDDDFWCALAITQVLTQHAAGIYVECYDGKRYAVAKSEKVNRLYNSLPERFTTREFINLADNMGINIKTAPGYLPTFIDKGFLVRLDQGLYEKRYPPQKK